MNIKKVTTLLTFFFILIFPLAAAQDKKPCRDIPLVMLETVRTQEMELHKTFEAALFGQTLELTAPRTGTLTAVKVAPGDIISENWEVAVIDNALADEIKALEDNLARWQRILQQRENWAERSPAAEAQATRNIEQYQTELEAKKEEAAAYRVISPLAGTVIEILVSEGDPVEEGAPVAVVKNTEEMLFEITLPEEQKDSLTAGEEYTVTLLKDNTVATAAVVENQDGKARLTIANSGGLIAEGDRVSLKILTARDPQAEFIPPAVIQEDDGGPHVFIPEFFPESVQSRKVYITTGEEIDGQLWVRDGLDGITHVIRTALHCLSDGKNIQVLAKDPATGKLTLLKNQEDAAGVMKAVPEGEAPVPEPEEEVVAEPEPEDKEKPVQKKQERRKARKEKKKEPLKAEPEVEEKATFTIVPFLEKRKKNLKYFNFSREQLDEDRISLQLSGRELNIRKLTKIIEKFKYEKFCVEKTDGLKTFSAIVFKVVTPELIRLQRGFASRLGVFLYGGGEMSFNEVLRERMGDIQIRFGLAVDGRISEGFGAFLAYTNQTNKGELSFEGETTLSNHIITIGPRYNYKRFFVKAGLSLRFFQEKNDAYTFSDSMLGYYIGTGARLLLKEEPLNFIRSLHAMLEIGYAGGVYQPEEEGIKEVDFSGISANVGIYIKF